MHALTFLPQARSHLTGQIARSQHAGAGFMCAYPLIETVTEKTVEIAKLMVITHGPKDLSVMSSFFGRQSFTTLPVNDLSADRIVQILSEHANLKESLKPSVNVNLQASSDLGWTLRAAVFYKIGDFLLPVEELKDFYLLLYRTSPWQERPSFHFELDGVVLSSPDFLPDSDHQALQLLWIVTQSLASTYSKG